MEVKDNSQKSSESSSSFLDVDGGNTSSAYRSNVEAESNPTLFGTHSKMEVKDNSQKSSEPSSSFLYVGCGNTSSAYRSNVEAESNPSLFGTQSLPDLLTEPDNTSIQRTAGGSVTLESVEANGKISMPCSKCATRRKVLVRATHFCRNCGSFGEYMCEKCHISHNEWHSEHKVKTLSVDKKRLTDWRRKDRKQSTTRGHTEYANIDKWLEYTNQPKSSKGSVEIDSTGKSTDYSSDTSYQTASETGTYHTTGDDRLYYNTQRVARETYTPGDDVTNKIRDSYPYTDLSGNTAGRDRYPYTPISCRILGGFKNHEEQHKEITELKNKVDELENALEQSEGSRMCRQVESLSEKVNSLETLILDVQTDDSKLHPASVRKSQEVSVTEKDSDHGNAKSKQNGKSGRLSKDGEGMEVDVARVQEVKNTNPVIADTVTNVQKSKPASQNVSHENDDLPSDAAGRIQKSNSNFTAKSSLPKDAMSSKEQRSDTSKSSGSDKNTGDSSSVGQLQVEVINDPFRKSYVDEQIWRALALQELYQAKGELKDLRGVHSVICLDISASMAEGNAWTEATVFLQDYLTGLDYISSRYGIKDESLALVTFGHTTKVQQRPTNKYDKIRDLIGRQKLGGPSPIYGGLEFALAAGGSPPYQKSIVNGVPVHTKIILITDGHVTEVCQYGGPDTCDGNIDETHAKILQLMEELKDRGLETFIVPVGNANHEFLELMSSFDGKMLTHKSGNELSRRYYLSTKIVDPYGLFSLGADELSHLLPPDLTEDDKRIMEEIKEGAKERLQHLGANVTGKNRYQELPFTNLAPIGSRVRRGPDWKWNAQDSNGPGTVIGHEDGGHVWVEWDVDSHQNLYRYGGSDYDVLIIEEPRALSPGQSIAVGCIVKPSKKGYQDRRGVVIKLENSSSKVTVRWKGGAKNEEVGRNEIEVCTGFQPFQSEGNVLGFDEPTSTPEEKKPTKNKNKNI